MRIELLALRLDARDAVAREHRFELARGRLDACEELARNLVLPELVADCDECAVQVILDRQHVAREIGGGVAGRLLQLRFQAAADVLRLRCRVESLVICFLELPLKLGEAVVLLQLRRLLRGFVADIFRLVMGLRLAEGIDADAIAQRLGTPAIVNWRKVDRLVASGHLARDGGRISLTSAGRLVLDYILAEISAEADFISLERRESVAA